MDYQLSNRISLSTSKLQQIDQRVIYEAQNLARLKSKISQLEKDKALLVKSVGVIDKTIEVISANGIKKIESIVSAGLRLVFQDSNWSLVIDKKETARGNSYQLLVQHGEVIGKPMETFGGGVVNVVAFLLRLIMVRRFKLAKFLAVDESFNNISGRYLPRVSEMLQKLCSDHGFNILAITHQPVLAQAADRIYEAKLVDGQPTLQLQTLPT